MDMAYKREITPVSYNLAEKIDLIGETGDTRFSFRVTGWQMADSIEKSVARTDSLKTRTREKWSTLTSGNGRVRSWVTGCYRWQAYERLKVRTERLQVIHFRSPVNFHQRVLVISGVDDD